MNFAGYVRVSRVGDREDGSYISPSLQRQAIASYPNDTVRENL